MSTSLSLPFQPYSGLTNGVTPAINFFKHMYETTSAGLYVWNLNTVSADKIYCGVQLSTPFLSLSAITLTANNGGSGSASGAISGVYGCIYNNFYDTAYFATRNSNKVLAAASISGDLYYFKWTSLIHNSYSHTISGLTLFYHDDVELISDNPSLVITATDKYITVTAMIWNQWENTLNDYRYDLEYSGDAKLYIKNKVTDRFIIEGYTMSAATIYPKSDFFDSPGYWATFLAEDIWPSPYDDLQLEYYVILTESWHNQTTTTLIGSATASTSPARASYDISTVTEQKGGDLYGNSITSGHSAIAVCTLSGNNTYCWKDIFRETWTL